MSAKKFLNVQKTLLDLFWKLAQQNVDERIQASVAIVTVLCNKQNEASDEKEMCNELKYSVERLVKGLASPRDAARLGYTLVLTEILRQLEIIRIDKILELIKQHLSVTTKQEVFGQVFTYSALVRSGRLKDDSNLSVVVTSLFHLSIGKSYILRACYEIFVDLFSQVSEENFAENVWPILKKDFRCGWEKCTTDVLWLFFLCMRMFPNAVSPKFLKKKWGNEDIFSSESINYIKNLMKQTTNVLPMEHPLCSEFIQLTLQRKDFMEIWCQIVDENLFEAEQVEKTFLGFQMIKTVLQNTKKNKIVKGVLSAKFCRLFTSSFMNASHLINPAATQLTEFFCEYVKDCEGPESQVIILKTLLLTPDGRLIHQILTKRKISIIVSYLLPDAVKELSEILKSTILGKSLNSFRKDADEVENLQQEQAANQIAAIISHPATILDFEWRLDTIKFLFLHSLFSVTEPNAEIPHCAEVHHPLPVSVRSACGGSFIKALDSLYRWTDGSTAPLQQYLQFLLNIFEYADQLIQATTTVTPLFELEKVENSWLMMKKSVNKLMKQSKKDGVSSENNAFQILFLQLGMQLFFDKEPMSDTIEELQLCCDKAIKSFKISNESVSEDSEEPQWISVVVDILLSLLSGQSLHMRRLVCSVFPSFRPYITNEALQQILDVINPSKTTEDMLVDESDAENEDNVKDVEFESGSSSEEGDDSNKNDEMQADEDFKQKIRQALGPAADDSDSESEVVLSDSDMFKLDDAISKAFLMRKKTGHTQLSLEDETLLNFRVRCLDLIIAYLKSEPPLKRTLQCIQPILTAYEYGNQGRHQSPLFHKAVLALQNLTRVKSFLHCHDVQISEIETILDTLIEKCHRESNAAVSKKLHSLCVFIIRCIDKLKGIPSSNEKQHLNGKKPVYIQKYISTLEPFVKQTNSHMVPNFFVSLLNLHPEFSWHFTNPLIEYAFDNTNRIYKRTQCLGLLLQVLRFAKNQETVTSQDWLEFGNQTIPPAVETIVSTIKNSDIKPLYITELLDVIFTGSRIVKEKSNQDLLVKHPELLTCFQDMTGNQVRLLSKKGKLLMKKIMLTFGVPVSRFVTHNKDMQESFKAEKRELELKMKKKNKKKRLSLESASPKGFLNVKLENGDTDSS